MDWLFGACKAPQTEGDVSFADPRKTLRPIKFEGPVDLPGMPGMQGLLSNPITELTPEEWKDFYIWCWKHYSGKCPIQQPGVYKDLGGGVTHRKLLYQATGLMAWITSVSVELHETLSGAEENTLTLCNYTDGNLKEMSKKRTIRLHPGDEFRVSVTFEKFPARDAVNTPSIILQHVLDGLGKSKLKVNRGQPSPIEEGKLSALTDPLEEGTTIEQVYEEVKQYLTSKNSRGFLVKDDGVFETEVRDGLIRNSGMKSRWFQPKDGVLEVLQILPNGELLSSSFVRISAGPPTVAEAWTIEPHVVDYAKMGENEQDRTNFMLVKLFDSWPGKA
mmetsp:Transcript_18490/g.37724  ORF Transcript_18490/g.37724 Transcript_18490/m.37724 type:complete len:332 (+) Transcript_18490:95-1090(+)